MDYLLIGIIIVIVINTIGIALFLYNQITGKRKVDEREKEFFHNVKNTIAEHQNKALSDLQDNSNKNLITITKTVQETLSNSSQQVDSNVKALKKDVEEQLKTISEKVEQRLSDGFDKNSTVFQQLSEKITAIDNAQNKIKELSENVVELQDVLSDKKSRGAFGEVQLNQIVKNIIPSSNAYFQKELSNGTRVDCLIEMPDKSKSITIDSKFPLENYKKMVETNIHSSDKKNYERAFKQDLKKHIDDIANKYIVNNETAEHAILFLPAEAIFSEIHVYHYDIVEYAHKRHVVLTSPNTLVALLTTVKSILKDEATKKQVHIIKEHLQYLAQDFDRFQKRFEDLSKHIKQANDDAEKVKTSGDKISSRFIKIQNVKISKDDESDKE